MKKMFTLAIVVQEGRVLLGRKVRKLGAGKWNGFGGKVEAGETVEQAVCRECEEEAGVRPTRVRPTGRLVMHYPGRPLGADVHEIHVYRVEAFEGVLSATDEMAEPKWFDFGEVPYGEMWADDQHWLPHVLQGKWVEGEFWFSGAGELVRQEVFLDKLKEAG